MTLQVGDTAPDFTLPDQTRTPRSLSEHAGSKRLVVFIPFPFTRTCEAELCTIRDNLSVLSERDAEVFVITCDTTASNKRWAEEQGFEFPILSDFWPHGEVSQAYDCFNDALGVANRATFTIDQDGVIRDVVTTGSLGEARDFEDYTRALDALSG